MHDLVEIIDSDFVLTNLVNDTKYTHMTILKHTTKKMAKVVAS